MTAKTTAIDNGCIGLKLNGKTSTWCGKIRAENSPYCPKHKAIYEDSLKEPQRRAERIQQQRDARIAEEAFLKTSPLRGENPTFVERSGRNRRARPSPGIDGRRVSQPSEEFQVDPDPLAEILADVASDSRGVGGSICKPPCRNPALG